VTEKGFGLLNAFAWSIYDFGLCNAFVSSANGFGLVNVFACSVNGFGLVNVFACSVNGFRLVNVFACSVNGFGLLSIAMKQRDEEKLRKLFMNSETEIKNVQKHNECSPGITNQNETDMETDLDHFPVPLTKTSDNFHNMSLISPGSPKSFIEQGKVSSSPKPFTEQTKALTSPKFHYS
jgi:stress-induced morphogen